MGEVEKKCITKAWMQEIFLQGHILSIGGDALSTWQQAHMLLWIVKVCEHQDYSQ
jgi:hypothetical protein